MFHFGFVKADNNEISLEIRWRRWGSALPHAQKSFKKPSYYNLFLKRNGIDF